MIKPVKALQDFLDQFDAMRIAQGDKPAPNSKTAYELEAYER